MRTKTRAIVLNTVPYSESSLIVKAYTEELGQASFIVSGVRSGKGKFHPNLFQPLSLLEIIATGKPGQSMLRITDAQLSPPFTGIPTDIVKSTMALFLAEVIYRSIREEEGNPAMFGFIHNAIQILDLAPAGYSRFHLFFMVQLTRYAGFYPNESGSGRQPYFDLHEGRFTSSSPLHPEYTDQAISDVLRSLINATFDNFHELTIPSPTARVAMNTLIRYYELHLTHGREIISHKILEEVLS